MLLRGNVALKVAMCAILIEIYFLTQECFVKSWLV